MIFGCEKETIAAKKRQNRKCFSNHFYCTQMKLRKGNVFTPVCDSVHRGEVYIPWANTSPPGRHLQADPPRQTDTAPGQTPPRADTPRQIPLGRQTSPWADTPSPEMTTAADGTHPTGMHLCSLKEQTGIFLSHVSIKIK